MLIFRPQPIVAAPIIPAPLVAAPSIVATAQPTGLKQPIPPAVGPDAVIYVPRPRQSPGRGAKADSDLSRPASKQWLRGGSVASTIKQVAEQAGVSSATVSRVFSGRDPVSPEVATRVRAVAEELGYRPSRIARSLRTKESKTLALVIPDVAEPFFALVMRGIEQVTVAAGYSLLLFNTDENPERERHELSVIQELQVSGVMIAPISNDSDLSGLIAASIPIVVFDRETCAPVDTILTRNADAARDATEHLLAEGWRRPGIITGPQRASTAISRLAGYMQAVTEVPGLTPIVAYSDYSEAGGEQAALKMLTGPNPPDALLSASTTTAIGVLSTLHKLGLEVGRDIGLVMFDEPSWAKYFSPSVTTVVQQAHEIGVQAAKLLIDRIENGGGAPRQIELTATLIPRASSRRTPQ